MAHDLIRLMHALFLPIRECAARRWCPAADVYRGRHGWLIKMDLAGVRPQDLHVSVRGRRVIVRGRRRDVCVEEGYRHHHLEIAYSRFERGIELPCDPGGADIVTEYRDGMLLITIRTEEENP